MKSRAGESRVWCVVEASEDRSVYEKFFSSDDIVIMTSEDDKGRRGCGNVEIIVRDLNAEFDNIKLFGIRDKDYTRFDKSYILARNVFLTDCRDIEMMLLSMTSVRNVLSSWDNQLEGCKQVAREIAYLRIYNQVYRTSCMFRDIIKASLFIEDSSHTFKADCLTKLFEYYKLSCGIDIDYQEVLNLIKTEKLAILPDSEICRGHDVIKLLQWILSSPRYSEKEIFKLMVSAVSEEDIQSLQLYQDISSWFAKRGLRM